MNSSEISKHNSWMAIYSLVVSILLFFLACLGTFFATPSGIAFLAENLPLSEFVDLQDKIAQFNGIGWFAASYVLLFNSIRIYLKSRD